MNTKKIAILGATGHIAKNLIIGLAPSGHDLMLFARSVESVFAFLKQHELKERVCVMPIDQFRDDKYDVVINCIGIGDPGKLSNDYRSVFSLTEKYDDLVLDYLQRDPDSLYINFSSGAAYGKNFYVPASDTTVNEININHLTPADFYGIAKVNSEAKHRAASDLNIVDLRIFGFFSRHMDLKSKFFMSDLINCLQSGTVLTTTSENFLRDYIHPRDLTNLIELCMNQNGVNGGFDAFSRKPVEKYEVLISIADRFGLKYEINDEYKLTSATGSKSHYYSVNKNSETKLGFQPLYTSLQSIMDEVGALKTNV